MNAKISTVRVRPILMAGSMVRATLERRKRCTRRVVNPQPPEGVGRIQVGRYEPAIVDRDGELQPGPEIFGAYDEDGEWGVGCPYGEPGDRLWVRETWAPSVRDPESEHDPRTGENCDAVHAASVDPSALWTHYEDDGSGRMKVSQCKPTWRPSIHMPRWASRITLAVTSVRVERLQAITTTDIEAEGVMVPPCAYDKVPEDPRVLDYEREGWARGEFAALWDGINGKRPGCAWASNPWVWVIGFEMIGGAT